MGTGLWAAYQNDSHLSQRPPPRLCIVGGYVSDEDQAFGSDFSFLRQFQSQYRKSIVTNDNGRVYTDGKFLNERYYLKRFHRGSGDLVKEPSSECPLLVAKALMESAL